MPTPHVPPAGHFDSAAITSADRITDRAITDLLNGPGRPRGVVVTAPAGAGKSHLVSAAVGRARDRGLRVAVAAPTNEQAFGLVRTIAALHGGQGRAVAFVPASHVTLPASVRALPGVRELAAKETHGEG